MSFTIKVWKVKLTVDLLDFDTSDRDIKLGITVSW